MPEQIQYRKTASLLFVYAGIGIAVGLVSIAFQQMMSVVNVFILEGIAGYGETRIVWGDRRISLPWPRPASVRWWLLPGLAGLGGLLTGWIVTRFAPEAGGHGTDEVIEAYHTNKGLRARASVVKMIASAITLGTGGSGGKEGPITQIGAGFASLLVQHVPTLRKYRREIILAGMSAGIAAIFRAPLAAAIFATEILYSDLRFEGRALIPAIIASSTSYAVYSMYFGFRPVFSLPEFSYTLSLLHFPIFSVLGIITALAAILFVHIYYKTRDVFRDMAIPTLYKPAIGGVLTGLVAIAVPPVLGEGSYGLQKIIAGEFSLGLLALCFFGKMIATSFSIASGGAGGTFGPSLFAGAALGGVFGGLYQWLFPGSDIPLTVFILVGMVGFFSGAANAPIATVIIVAEMTRSFNLLAPFIWVSAFGFLFSQRWNIYENQVTDATDVMVASPDDRVGRESCSTTYDGL
jgi:chloride channel protein, CIC family